MATYKRKKPRTLPSGGYSSKGLERRLNEKAVPKGDRKGWTGSYPRHWDKVFHTRPTRARSHLLLVGILKGERDPDDTVFPNGRKPHIYYW